MGPNNVAVSGSIDGFWVSTGPNSLGEAVFAMDASNSVGSNSFGDSECVDVFLDGENDVSFL